MKLSTNILKLIIIIGFIIFILGIVFLFQLITPNEGIVIDKNITMYKSNFQYKVLIKSNNFPIPLWITVTKNYFDELSINDIYNKNENSYMYSYWLGK